MATDALMQFQSSVTKTAPFTGAAFLLPGGTRRSGLKARVIYSAASVSSGTGTLQFGLDVSYDGGSTWNLSLFQSNVLALSTTAIAGQLHIPFDVSPTSVVNGVQIRMSVEAITGTGATVTYVSDLDLGRP